jgi:plastocyanin
MKKWLIMISLLGAWTTQVQAGEPAEYTLVIEGHRFIPAELAIPAGKKIKLVIVNKDTGAEEFESYALNREKIIPGKSSARVFVGPLKPGRYAYFGDFHQDVAKGVLIAR